jgi:hypothetical protein
MYINLNLLIMTELILKVQEMPKLKRFSPSVTKELDMNGMLIKK